MGIYWYHTDSGDSYCGTYYCYRVGLAVKKVVEEAVADIESAVSSFTQIQSGEASLEDLSMYEDIGMYEDLLNSLFNDITFETQEESIEQQGGN